MSLRDFSDWMHSKADRIIMGQRRGPSDTSAEAGRPGTLPGGARKYGYAYGDIQNYQLNINSETRIDGDKRVPYQAREPNTIASRDGDSIMTRLNRFQNGSQPTRPDERNTKQESLPPQPRDPYMMPEKREQDKSRQRWQSPSPALEKQTASPIAPQTVPMTQADTSQQRKRRYSPHDSNPAQRNPSAAQTSPQGQYGAQDRMASSQMSDAQSGYSQAQRPQAQGIPPQNPYPHMRKQQNQGMPPPNPYSQAQMPPPNPYAEAQRRPSQGMPQQNPYAEAQMPPGQGMPPPNPYAEAQRPPSQGMPQQNPYAEAQMPPSQGIPPQNPYTQAQMPPSQGIPPQNPYTQAQIPPQNLYSQVQRAPSQTPYAQEQMGQVVMQQSPNSQAKNQYITPQGQYPPPQASYSQQQVNYDAQQPWQAASRQALINQSASRQSYGNTVVFPGMMRSRDGSVYSHVEYIVSLHNRSDCAKVINYIKANASVFLSMEYIASEEERLRCVDVLFGAINTLGCNLHKISSHSIYLISSPLVKVVPDPLIQGDSFAPDDMEFETKRYNGLVAKSGYAR